MFHPDKHRQTAREKAATQAVSIPCEKQTINTAAHPPPGILPAGTHLCLHQCRPRLAAFPGARAACHGAGQRIAWEGVVRREGKKAAMGGELSTPETIRICTPETS